MQERNRAYRRWRRAVKKSAVKYYSTAGVYFMTPRVQTDRKILGIISQTPKNCGCWMCANMRKGHGLTFSETKERLQASIDLGLEEYFD